MKALAIALALVACGKHEPAKQEANPAAAPESIAQRQLAWVVDTIVAHGGKLERAEVDKRFAPAFLKQVPADQLVAIFDGLGEQLEGMKVIDVKADSPTHLVAHAKAGNESLRILLGVDPKTNLIEELLLQPDAPPAAKLASFDDAKQALAKLAPHASLLIASVDAGACKPLQASDADAELAIGSAFKLYVLLGLSDRLIAGTVHWDDPIAVRDDWKSLPSGITQNDAAGTKLPLRTLAERMISISDNTATDHVLNTIGRTQAETALREAKHDKPALDTPFLSTRELFLLKLATPVPELARYLAMTEPQRRDYLDKTLAGKQASLAAAATWKTARQIDRLEWFASANDLCRVMATLQARAQDPKAAAVLDVLAKNPGIPLDTATWPYIGFKGGSEPGVLDLTWLVRRKDQKWLVVTISLNANEGGEVDEGQTIAFATGVFALAAKI